MRRRSKTQTPNRQTGTIHISRLHIQRLLIRAYIGTHNTKTAHIKDRDETARARTVIIHSHTTAAATAAAREEEEHLTSHDEFMVLFFWTLWCSLRPRPRPRSTGTKGTGLNFIFFFRWVIQERTHDTLMIWIRLIETAGTAGWAGLDFLFHNFFFFGLDVLSGTEFSWGD